MLPDLANLLLLGVDLSDIFDDRRWKDEFASSDRWRDGGSNPSSRTEGLR